MNLDRDNADTIPIKSLLECSTIPSPRELGKAGQLGKRIVEPFERVLDRCDCFSWQYSGEAPESYADFAQGRVKIHWHTRDGLKPRVCYAFVADQDGKKQKGWL